MPLRRNEVDYATSIYVIVRFKVRKHFFYVVRETTNAYEFMSDFCPTYK